MMPDNPGSKTAVTVSAGGTEFSRRPVIAFDSATVKECNVIFTRFGNLHFAGDFLQSAEAFERNLMKYKRILLKLSGEALQNKAKGLSIDPEVLAAIGQQFRQLIDEGAEIAVVVGGGNIFRGLAGEQNGTDRTTGDHMGMLATVINALALQSALENVNIQTRVMTAINMPAVAEPFIRRKAMRHLEKGRVVIFGAGTGNPYFTTDSAAALRASEIGADVLMKATKVDGIYTADPLEDRTAIRYEKISCSEALRKQLKIMDAAAFSLCMENDIPIVVFNFFKKDEMLRVFRGENVGTLVSH
ncbi:MAG: uridylate kinase [Verrucomicrobiota bacterium]|nr:uridylate kinase [Verrucomicrobiota bacterium]